MKCPSLALATVGWVCMALHTATGADNLLCNPGFEQLGANGLPTGWTLAVGRVPLALTRDAPHGGQRALRVAGDGQNRFWRQEVARPATRNYLASGWFRADQLKVDAQARPQDYARLYIHVVYQGRPDTDTTHAFADLPVGTYGWRRVAVRVSPRDEWPIDKIRLSVVTRFRSGTLDFDDLALDVAPARSGALARDWRNGRRPRTITDLGRCTPTAALSATAAKGRWQLIDYEAGELKGRLVWASEEAAARPLTLALNANGWHAVYVGLTDPSSLGCHALLRLTGDAAYVPRSRTVGQIEEVFFKVADLSGQSLHIAQESGGLGRACGVAYVKLVPLTPDEVAAVQADRQNPACRKLATTIDGFSFIYGRRPTSVESLLPEVEIYRHTDFDTLILQMGGADMVNYRSRIGEMRGQDLSVFPRRGDRFYAEAIGELARQGINPTQVLIEGAQRAGLKVHVGLRPAAWIHSPPGSDFFNSRFYQAHPEWRCVDRDGTPVARMSLAVPEVRRHLVDVLREAVAFGADGACVLYNRGVPLVLFEKPFCTLFQQRYHADALAVADDDPRILALRQDLLTAFMRGLRTMLDEEGQRRRAGKRLALSAFVLANEADNLRYGLNVRQWVEQGLVDELFPFLSVGGGTARHYDMKFFSEVCRAKQVRVRPGFVAWNTPNLGDVMQQVLTLYDARADGITVWDGNSGADNTGRWSIVSRMGHLDELRETAETRPPAAVTQHFHTLGGMTMDGPYRPNWGY